jgi:hypothetical protein
MRTRSRRGRRARVVSGRLIHRRSRRSEDSRRAVSAHRTCARGARKKCRKNSRDAPRRRRSGSRAVGAAGPAGVRVLRCRRRLRPDVLAHGPGWPCPAGRRAGERIRPHTTDPHHSSAEADPAGCRRALCSPEHRRCAFEQILLRVLTVSGVPLKDHGRVARAVLSLQSCSTVA